ncbi:MAG TPA: ABC transporter permease subunit [Planctomycetota bacterium]|nr:ABC transporter permease subunit [Planctomycetota bacterium]
MSRPLRAAVVGLIVAAPFAAVLAEGVAAGGLAALVDPDAAALAWNSIALGATAALFAALLAVPFAALAAFRTFPLRGALTLAVATPLLVPLHVHAIGWMRIFGRQGYLTAWLAESTGYVHEVRAPWLGLYPGPAWILACAWFPLAALPTLAGLRALDHEALEAARLAGVGRLGVLRRIVLPAVAPRLCGGLFLVFAFTLASFPVTSLLDTPVLSQRIFFAFSRDHAGGPAAAALQALPLLLAAACVAVWLPRAAAETAEGFRTRLRPRRGGVLALAAAAAPLVLAVGPPLWGLVWKLVEARRLKPHAPSPFRDAFRMVETEFVNSFLLSAGAAALLLVVAWPLAWSLARRPSGGLSGFLDASVAAPPIVLGLGVVLFWRRFADVPILGGVYGGAALVVFAYLARFLPVVLRVLATGFGPEAGAQDDAARLAGHGPLRRAVGVLLPGQAGVLAAALVLGYVCCFVELDATLMTHPPAWRTVQVRLFNMVHYRGDDEVAALCLLAVGAALLPPAVVALLAPRRRRVR